MRAPCQRHVAGRAAWRVPGPVGRPGHAEGEPDRGVARAGPREDTARIGVALAPVAPPGASPPRGRAPLGQAAGITGAEALGFPQPLDHVSTQPGEHQPVLPGGRPAARGSDEALDRALGRHRLGGLAVPGDQEACQGAGPRTLASLGLPRGLGGHHESAQPLHQMVEPGWRNAAVPPQRCLTPGPRGDPLVASSPGLATLDAPWKRWIEQRIT